MGRLVIAHHKSYHPYKAENIERVRRDEEEARLKEAKEEGRLRLADSEARLELLRKRAGISASSSKQNRTDEDLIPDAVKESLKEQQAKDVPESPLQSLMTDGHINLFADLENKDAVLKQAVDRSKKQKGKKDSDEDDAETDKGYRLAPSKADRAPWYTKSKEEGQPKLDPARRDRDEIRKQKHDPLKEIEASLSRASSSSRISPPRVSSKNSMGPPSIPSSSSNTMLGNRLSREHSERQRAAELIARKRKERMGNETPTTVAPSEAGYGNMYNKDDVEAAARRRREGDSTRWKER
ncbi:3858_t:CDS:2, partial [Acaulospora colombiana]